MQGQFSLANEDSGYWENMLIVKLRRPPRWDEDAILSISKARSRGWSMLLELERRSAIKVTPLGRLPEWMAEEARERWAPYGALGPLVMPEEEFPSDDANAGVSILEVEDTRELGRLQTNLAKDDSVEFVDRVPVRLLVDTSPEIAAAPPPASQMWNLHKILWSRMRGLPGFKEASDIPVAVLDTGIDREHPDLRGQVTEYVYTYPELETNLSDQDVVGHGTHVAGTIAGGIGNNLGINGICDCKLHVWKIFDDKPRCNRSGTEFKYYVNPKAYYRALADCLARRIPVINLSIGGTKKPDHHGVNLFRRLVANGTAVVVAMGNDREMGSPTSYPAALPGVIAVGATRRNDTWARFSNAGDHISLCAPGEAIWSTLPTYPGQLGFRAVQGPDGRPVQGPPVRRDTEYAAWQGTSMAAPHVAAAAALLIANKGHTPADAVRRQLMSSADKVPGMRGRDWDRDYGAGRLNLLRLLSQ